MYEHVQKSPELQTEYVYGGQLLLLLYKTLCFKVYDTHTNIYISGMVVMAVVKTEGETLC